MDITKIIEWDMGHRIPNHKSKCRHLHGHRYRLEITVTGPIVQEAGSDQGMVMDFGDIKTIAMETIHDPFDHKCLISDEDPEAVFFRDITGVIFVPFIPTAENLILYFADILIPAFNDRGFTLSSLRLFETPNSWADLTITA